MDRKSIIEAIADRPDGPDARGWPLPPLQALESAGLKKGSDAFEKLDKTRCVMDTGGA